MYSLIIKFALMLLKWCKYQHPRELVVLEPAAYKRVQKYLPAVRTLVEQAYTAVSHADGHGRRHWVYVKLCRSYVKTPRRDLNLAIELAVQERANKISKENI